MAKTHRESELKMKVTDRSCCERVNELLKNHRKEEASIIRSTGATDDEDSEIKKLLVIVNDMSSLKPAQKDSTVYQKKKKTEGETITDAVLDELSNSDSDDYVNDKYPRNDSGKKSRNNEEIEVITSVNAFFSDNNRSLAEEELIFEESFLHSPEQIQLESWQVIPSTSSDSRHSIPVSDLTSQGSRPQCVQSQSQFPQSHDSLSTSTGEQPSNNVSESQQSSSLKKVSSQPQKDNRFTNPKKDLVTFLEKKSESELEIRREEVRLREMEATNKTEELKILRMKAEAEMVEKKEELQILRIKTEAEAEERKQIQDLLISLVKKNKERKLK